MPLTRARMREMVEREAEVRARVIADHDRIETEIEARSEAKAREMYEARAFPAVVALPDPDPTDGPPGPRLAATDEETSPGTASRPDLTVGWPAKQERDIRRLGRR